MRSLRVVAIGLALLAGSAWPVVGPPAAGCANDAPHAGLVVDNGSRTLELCVTLDAASVTGEHAVADGDGFREAWAVERSRDDARPEGPSTPNGDRDGHDLLASLVIARGGANRQ